MLAQRCRTSSPNGCASSARRATPATTRRGLSTRCSCSTRDCRSRMSGRPPDRNLALELVRVTEAGAIGAARWVGRGEKEPADQGAVDGMRAVLATVSMNGVVVIGEGEKDEAPMLYNGEHVGDGTGAEVDVAVDPRAAAGARVPLTRDGDGAPASAAAQGGLAAIDLLMGIGGPPEGVIAASAIKCLGGGMQAKPWPRHDEDRQKLVDAGYDVDK